MDIKEFLDFEKKEKLKNKKETHRNISPRLKVETIEKLKQLSNDWNVSINKVLEFLITKAS